MAQYIDKTKVEEILRSLWKKDDGNDSEHRICWICYNKALQEVQCQIDALEVKEVDLEKEIQDHIRECLDVKFPTTIEYTSRKFFELGLQARQDKELVEEVYSHIDGIKDTADRMTSGNFMHHKAAIKFSANTIATVLGLIGLNPQKGE